MPARMVVEEAWNKKLEFHKSGELMYLTTPCPWKDHLFELEQESDQYNQIKFVLFPDERKMIRVQTVPVKGDFFS
jgi:uncharacterized UPF0160 family protein